MENKPLKDLTTPKTIAVIVSYEPDLDLLAELLAAVLPQVDETVIVDNGSLQVDLQRFLQKRFSANLCFLPLNDNRGIAAAQNRGIDWGRRRNASHILILDQDSKPAPDMVQRLHLGLRRMADLGCKVAAVGPRHYDARRGCFLSFWRQEGLRSRTCQCAQADDVVAVDHVISSGCLIPLSVLDAVGGMVEEMFIDYVDIEWSMRARYHGYEVFGVCNAILHHRLGDDPSRFFSRTIDRHSPVRRYYQFRNAIYLYRQTGPAWNWKVADSYRLLRKYVFFALFQPPRFQQMRMMTLGLWHGLRGRMGRYEGADVHRRDGVVDQ